MTTATHSHSDAPSARHATDTHHAKGGHRWTCSCGRRGKLAYEMKGVAAQGGWAHERAMNGPTR